MTDMTPAVTFTVHGTPGTQGSKTRNRDGSFREADRKLKDWREQIQLQGRLVMRDREPLDGKVVVHAMFMFDQPKSRRGERWHSAKPDLDKLIRAVGDGLSGIVVKDDARIVQWMASKQYGEPGVVVNVYVLRGEG